MSECFACIYECVRHAYLVPMQSSEEGMGFPQVRDGFSQHYVGAGTELSSSTRVRSAVIH